jgi:hypothetical protein
VKKLNEKKPAEFSVRDLRKNQQRMGPLRFELRTSAMSRRRHSQLDHEPAYNLMLYSICHLIIKK